MFKLLLKITVFLALLPFKFFLCMARAMMSPEVMEGMIKEDQRRYMRRIYVEKEFAPQFHPDNPNNPIKHTQGW